MKQDDIDPKMINMYFKRTGGVQSREGLLSGMR